MSEYLSCEQLETSLVLLPDGYFFCCLPTNGVLRPKICEDTAEFTYNTFIEARKNLISLNQTDRAPCKGCPQLRLGPWGMCSEVVQIIFATSYVCNSNCSYCPQRGVKVLHHPYPLQILEDLIAKKQIGSNALIHVSGGEPTLNENCCELIRLSIQNDFSMIIPTNGIIFSEEIFMALKERLSTVIISVDSPNAEVYKEVHGIDKFFDVIRNITKYASAGGDLKIKYLFVQENAAKSYVDDFLDLFIRVGCNTFIISMENFMQQENCFRDLKILECASHMYHELSKRNCRFEFCATMSSNTKNQIINFNEDAMTNTTLQHSIYDTYADSSLENWFSTLYQSVSQQNINEVLFPSFPSDEFQVGMVGACGVNTLHEISKFYTQSQVSLAKAGFTFSRQTSMLDFGCGFGRIIRFFLKDMPSENIYGVDTVESFIDICRSTFPVTVVPAENFITTSPYPPLPFQDNTFDLITAYSVFTHLSEHAANLYCDEMYRLLKPGGCFVFTIRQKSYLEYCNRLTNCDNLGYYQEIEAKSFGNFAERIKQYVKGEYMFVPNGGGDLLTADFYGDTVVPPSYVRKKWCNKFQLIEMFDDLNVVAQAFVVLKKPS